MIVIEGGGTLGFSLDGMETFRDPGEEPCVGNVAWFGELRFFVLTIEGLLPGCESARDLPLTMLDAAFAGVDDAASFDSVGIDPLELGEESMSGEFDDDGGADDFPRLIEIVPLSVLWLIAGEGNAIGTFASEDDEKLDSPRGLL